MIRDLANSDYGERIGKYLDAIDPKDRTDDLLYEDRLSVCKACEKLETGTCLACGCYVEIRAAGKKTACPIGKW
ncbi:MAG: hypothetical protein J5518_06395 [Lachnospiraceae bacterium]|nr:hypothetical protein [Lachnospiraceae bacterium]